MLEKLTHNDFASALHQKFQIPHGGASVEVELIECRSLPSTRRKDALREPFSVIFRGPREPVLPQRIHRLEGGPMGPLEIFIVPVGPDSHGMLYEAIFT